jgi:nucleoside-diphosphate-sugar epimerase
VLLGSALGESRPIISNRAPHSKRLWRKAEKSLEMSRWRLALQIVDAAVRRYTRQSLQRPIRPLLDWRPAISQSLGMTGEIRRTVGENCMRCLVTGGSGFFGHLLIERLLAHGDEVRSFDVNQADDQFASVEFQQGDIRNIAAVSRACEDVDIIYHNVAQQPLSRNAEMMKTVNLDGTRNLLSSALTSGVTKVVFTSSSAVFGVPTELPIRRSTATTPCETYGRTKVFAEHICREFIKMGLDVTIIRPRTILGHGRLGIFQMLFEWIREGRNLPVMDGGDNLFQFIHAHDLADATIRASHRPCAQVYNIGTDRFGTMREVLQSLCEHARTGSKVKSVASAPVRWFTAAAGKLGLSPLGAYHYLAYGKPNYFDISDAVKELSWRPRYSNEEMMIESYDWYLENREDVMKSRWASPHKSAVRQGILRLAIRLL